MSTRRRMPGAHSAPPPRSPEGLPLCRWCKKLVLPPRETFCSDLCVHDWRLRTDSSYVRGLLFERDGGLCAICRVDTTALYVAFRKTCHLAIGSPSAWSLNHRRPRPEHVLIFDRLRALDIDVHRRSFWDSDHVVPVAEGGGECGLDGYRTLCIPCHKKQSASYATVRAQRRRAA